jgi:putative membrane protein
MPALSTAAPLSDRLCLLLAVLAALAYVAGLARLWTRAGIGRGVSLRQALMFTAGWLAASLPALSSLHARGLSVFTLHMIEHELLIIVAAPLLVLSRPLPVYAWALGDTARRRLRLITGERRLREWWSALREPLPATLLHALALWAWHVPMLFKAALRYPSLHLLQHWSFFVTALLFWWACISREALRRWPAAATLALFATLMHSGLLGALLTFSRNYWYPGEPDLSAAWCGLSRSDDQQIAGLIMWLPGSLIYLLAALWLIGRRLTAAQPHPAAHAQGMAR